MRWHHEARVTLQPHALSPSQARQFVRSALRRWGCHDASYPVELAASEIVTNAAIHGQTEIDMTVMLNTTVVRVEVVDWSDRLPVVGHPSIEDVAGRGLYLVDAISRDWGVEPQVGGKKVWCEIDLTDSETTN